VCCDGLKGLPDAIEATWPLAVTQTCVLHLIRNSFRLASRADWDRMAKDLRPVYTAVNETDAKARLDDFDDTWGEKYPAIRALGQSVGTVTYRRLRDVLRIPALFPNTCPSVRTANLHALARAASDAHAPSRTGHRRVAQMAVARDRRCPPTDEPYSRDEASRVVPQSSHERGSPKGLGGKSRSRYEVSVWPHVPRSQPFAAGRLMCPRQDSNLWPTA
jgi:Transposase, Mutator family